ncbi:hypothetical protein NHX12_028904 [Muraenolepis orangiensis]|uniref:Uncharacterized protein n=1 Tax=Muraenolepis orangiensis TaxID=630683 RepID=A0A9Q0D6Z3_9TELE|nr:hypothetical protein NHX12_034486 [Muraenolepis orangiensis]KAJ3604163.1 hypothetical protein NHX12_028904 [Muraenolepis orangiensis]
MSRVGAAPPPMPCMSRVGAAPPPPLRREALQLDSALMFREPAGEVQRWLSGAGGVAVPGLGVALPYLPPFVSSLDTLHAVTVTSKDSFKTNQISQMKLCVAGKSG